jgi:peptidoglycan/LPS O-acetylase OafA/YrhL
MTNRIKHGRLKSVDALRAFAVLPVILFHLKPTWIPGGYLGVDVFFVLSGFLITGILLDGISAGTFSFWDFYARRIRRILPALLVMLLVVATIWLWYEPWEFGSIAKLARAAISMRANFAVKDMVGDYWGGDAQAQPLLHTWSLAVEEQFYLIYPLLAWGLWRFCSRRVALGVLAGLTFGSLVWHLRSSVSAPTTAFYDTTTRAWELLAGAFLAGFIHSQPANDKEDHSRMDWIGWGGLLLVALAYVSPILGVSKEWRPILAAIGTSAFLWAAPQRSGVHAVLGRPHLVYVGLISYSLYLWHWPIAVLFNGLNPVGEPGIVGILLEVFLIGSLGAASYHFIEKPCRHGRRITWVILAACIVSYFGLRQLAREQEKPENGFFETMVLADGRFSEGDVVHPTIGGFRRMNVEGTRFAEPVAVSPQVVRKYRHVNFATPEVRTPGQLIAGGDKRSSAKVLVWGDSHAMVMAPTLDKVAKELGRRAEFRIKEGIDPHIFFPPAGDDLDQAGLRALQARPDCCVFIFRYDIRRFADYEATFAEILKHTRLIVVQQPPVLGMPDKCTVDYFSYIRDRKHVDLSRYSLGEQGRSIEGRREFERRLVDRFASTPGFTFLRLDSVFRDADGRPIWWDGRRTLFYIDDDHLSEFGALKTELLIRSALNQPAVNNR